MILKRFLNPPSHDSYLFYCPGCKCDHCFTVRSDGGHPSWTYDGDHLRPTFQPSLLYPDRRCHLFVRDGQIEFLSDCSHELAGKTVPMVDYPTVEPETSIGD